MGNKFVLNLVGSRASFEDDFELDSDFSGVMVLFSLQVS